MTHDTPLSMWLIKVDVAFHRQLVKHATVSQEAATTRIQLTADSTSVTLLGALERLGMELIGYRWSPIECCRITTYYYRYNRNIGTQKKTVHCICLLVRSIDYDILWLITWFSYLLITILLVSTLLQSYHLVHLPYTFNYSTSTLNVEPCYFLSCNCLISVSCGMGILKQQGVQGFPCIHYIIWHIMTLYCDSYVWINVNISIQN